MTRSITSRHFERNILKGSGLSLVQFFKGWSGACQILAPLYEGLAGEYADIAFYRLDAEAEQSLAAAFGIRELPTILFFRDGRLVDRNNGLAPREMLVDKIENAIRNNAIGNNDFKH